jgi:Tfp pilus assembly protein PilF
LVSAAAHYQEALAVREGQLGAEHPTLAGDLFRIGSCLLELSQNAQAVAPLERALALRRKGDAPFEELAQTELALGKAVAATDVSRARSLGIAAEADFAKAGAAFEAERAEATQWLGTQPSRR